MACTVAVAAPPDGAPAAAAPEGTRVPADEFWSDEPQLLITGVTLDPETRRLTINGQNFGGHRLPTVKLGALFLSLSRSTDNMLVTDPLPRALDVGTHLVTVVAGNDRTRFDVYSLVVGQPSATVATAAQVRPNQVRILDSTGDVGWHTATAVGSDGNPLVAYLDYTNRDLKVIQCQDPSCGSASTHALDREGDQG